MPQSMWSHLGIDSNDMPLTVKISSSSHGGAPAAGTSSTFTIAPVGASGNLVYWSPSGSTNAGTGMVGNTVLSGFSVGSEMVKQVLVPTDIATPTTNYWMTMGNDYKERAVTCIGCHTSTPDGNFIGFNDAWPWGGVLASAAPGSMGMPPTFIKAGGFAAFIQPWVGIQTYTINHWMDGDHVVVAPLGTCGSGQPCASGSSVDADQQPGLAWFDLENTGPYTGMADPATTLKGSAWNWIVPPDTTNKIYAAAPSWSRAQGDDFIVYTGTSNVKSGRLGTGNGAPLSGPLFEDVDPDADGDPGRRLRFQLRAVLRHAVVRRRVHRVRPDSARPRRTRTTRASTPRRRAATPHLACGRGCTCSRRRSSS